MPAPGGIFHDYWIAFIAATAGKIDFIPDVLVMYRQHSNSITDLAGLRSDPGTVSLADLNKEKRLKYRQNLKAFINYPFIGSRDKQLFLAINQAYLRRENQIFSFSLVFFLFRHLNVFSIDDNTLIKKAGHAIREGFNPGTKARFAYYRGLVKRSFKQIPFFIRNA